MADTDDGSRLVASRELDLPWPAPSLAWYTVTLLSLAYVLSYLDRIVINLLIVPIQSDLGINDTQFGMLQSLAFGIFYITMALPLGRLADNRERRLIVAGGIAMFSLFTVLSGLAKTYGQLFCARIGVGVGEASLTPAAYSILSDYFPADRLGKAVGVFTMSAFIGTGLAYIGGGSIIDWLTNLGTLQIAGVDFKPWQLALIAVGLPGLLLAPMMLTLQEPSRRGGAVAERIPLQAVLQAVKDRWGALGWMFAGFSMVTVSSYAAAVWTPALFIRAYGWQPGQVGLWYGLIYLFLGTSGALFAGWLCDRLTAKGVLDAPLRIAAFGFVGVGLFGGIAPLMPNPVLALLMFVPATFMGTMPFPLAGTAIQLITPNRLRGQMSALYLTVINIVGLGFGPLIVGALTDYYFTEPADVRYSLALAYAFSGPLAFLFLITAFSAYRKLRQPMHNG